MGLPDRQACYRVVNLRPLRIIFSQILAIDDISARRPKQQSDEASGFPVRGGIGLVLFAMAANARYDMGVDLHPNGPMECAR